jgi:hypothetical protein
MAKVDWDQVAKDYEASTLDMAWVTAYAQKAAKLLVDHHVAPMGYTDEKQRELDNKIAEVNHLDRSSGGIVQFFQNLFSPDRDDHPKPLYCAENIGYWVLLEESEDELSRGREKNNYSGSTTEVMVAHHSRRSYCLLANGKLACFDYRDFCDWFGSIQKRAETSGGWSLMKEDHILLLDRRLRRQSSNRGRFGNDVKGSYYRRVYLSTDNYLITGKKGGGCRKLLRKLIEGHGIKDPRTERRDRSRSKIGAHAISKTYTVTGEQLKNGFALTHTFANGSTHRVDVYSGSRSGKAISVHDKAAGVTEWVRIVEG